MPRLFLSNNKGVAALEFALVGPPLILLLLGLLEFGRGLHIRNAIDAVADRAQRAIIIDPAASADNLEVEIRQAFRAGASDHLNVSFGSSSNAGQSYRLISLSYEMQLLLPTPLGRKVTIVSERRVATSL